MKITTLQAAVRAKIDSDGQHDTRVFPSLIEIIARATVEQMGFIIGPDGEIHDPRPAPVYHERMRETRPRYPGQRRRK